MEVGLKEQLGFNDSNMTEDFLNKMVRVIADSAPELDIINGMIDYIENGGELAPECVKYMQNLKPRLEKIYDNQNLDNQINTLFNLKKY